MAEPSTPWQVIETEVDTIYVVAALAMITANQPVFTIARFAHRAHCTRNVVARLFERGIATPRKNAFSTLALGVGSLFLCAAYAAHTILFPFSAALLVRILPTRYF